MIKLAYRFFILVVAFAAFIFSSCSKNSLNTGKMEQNNPQNMEPQPICLSVGVSHTKATIFDSPASLQNPNVGGGNFAVYAFLSGSNSTAADRSFMENVRVNYFSAAGDWRFTDSDGIYIKYYWPLGEQLNFFGHFPLNPADAAVYDVECTYENGPSFCFSLPLHAYDAAQARNEALVNAKTPNQEELREFLYSYVKDQTPQTQNADKNYPGVKMHFAHPFAAVSFNLEMSYRMTLHNITLGNIKYKGSYSYNNLSEKLEIAYDSVQGSTGNLLIDIEKGIPDDINFNSPIGGPYLVAPQELDKDNGNGAPTLSVNYTRLDGATDTKSIKLSDLGVTNWEAGKQYVYTLSMGNTEEEILFKVKVDKWTVIDYKTEIEVE